jgi:hypothetical protein
MRIKDFLIIFILSTLILTTTACLYLVFYNRQVLGIDTIPENGQNIDITKEVDTVEIASPEIVFPSINICYEQNCYYILPEVIEIFYEENEINKSQLYIYLLENVVPFFEDLSGGKEFVQNSKGEFYTWKEDLIVDTSAIYKGIEKLLTNRGEYELDLTYELYKKDLPGTDGKYAERYIEVDNSKQKLYAWLNGKVIKEINLSAAQRGFEVYGVFPIIDKGIQPMAPSGHYMPYWMAFYRSDWQDSWYGLHGLVWWYDDNGNKIFENTDYIGVRRSKGCIRMLKDDAKYLYDRYEKGDPILIHE